MWALQKRTGFTIVELLIVIVVIAILAAITIVAFNGVQARARDSQRLQDAKTIEKAIKLHILQTGTAPPFHTIADTQDGGWETSAEDTPNQFLKPLVDAGIISRVPVDPQNTTTSAYRYHLYVAGYAGCDPAKGRIAVFAIKDMETSGRPHPASPGFSCPTRDWQPETDYVIGIFENE